MVELITESKVLRQLAIIELLGIQKHLDELPDLHQLLLRNTEDFIFDIRILEECVKHMKELLKD